MTLLRTYGFAALLGLAGLLSGCGGGKRAHREEPDAAGETVPRQAVDLTALVGQLSSPESRANAIYKIVTRGERLSSFPSLTRAEIELLHQARIYFTEQKRFVQAAELAEREGAIDEAIALHLRDRNAYRAASVAERAENHERAIELFVQAGEFGDAAGIAQRTGQMDRAVTLLERGGQFLEAAMLAEAQHLPDKAIALYERLPNHDKAAQVAESAGRWEQAIAIYRRGDNLGAAGRIAEAHGRPEQALDLYEGGNLFAKAYVIATRLGNRSRAETIYRKAKALGERMQRDSYLWGMGSSCQPTIDGSGIFNDISHVMELHGDKEGAKRFSVWAQLWGDAARLAREGGNDEEALSYLERGACFNEAAALADQLGRRDRVDFYRQLEKQAPISPPPRGVLHIQ